MLTADDIILLTKASTRCFSCFHWTVNFLGWDM